MIYLVGAVIIALAGYCIALMLKLTKDHFLHDIALGWFVGAGYYSVMMFIIVYAVGLPAKAVYSIVVIMIPFMLSLLSIKAYRPIVIRSIRNIRKMEYLPNGRIFSFETILAGYCIFVIALVVAHGASTPTNADDAIHLRAYSPILVYMNDLSERARAVIISNGIWPSFLTLFFWHLKGEVDHFYINYTILTSFLSFLMLLYFAPVIRGEKKRGIYNVFLVLTLPLFIYHATTTYADAPMIMPFALGFMYFTFYLADMDIKDFKILALFFIITCLIKDKGIILGFTGLFISFLFFIYMIVKKKDYLLLKRIGFYTLPIVLLGLFVLFKTKYASSVWLLWGYVIKNLSIIDVLTIVNELYVFVIKPVFVGDPINWSASPYLIKLNVFINSMFASGNYGIVFYLLLVNIALNLKKIVRTPLIWQFAFFALVFLESFYFTVVLFPNLIGYTGTVHRVLMIPAVIASVLLPSLWSQDIHDVKTL